MTRKHINDKGFIQQPWNVGEYVLPKVREISEYPCEIVSTTLSRVKIKVPVIQDRGSFNGPVIVGYREVQLRSQDVEEVIYATVKEQGK